MSLLPCWAAVSASPIVSILVCHMDTCGAHRSLYQVWSSTLLESCHRWVVNRQQWYVVPVWGDEAASKRVLSLCVVELMSSCCFWWTGFSHAFCICLGLQNPMVQGNWRELSMNANKLWLLHQRVFEWWRKNCLLLFLVLHGLAPGSIGSCRRSAWPSAPTFVNITVVASPGTPPCNCFRSLHPLSGNLYDWKSSHRIQQSCLSSTFKDKLVPEIFPRHYILLCM